MDSSNGMVFTGPGRTILGTGLQPQNPQQVNAANNNFFVHSVFAGAQDPVPQQTAAFAQSYRLLLDNYLVPKQPQPNPFSMPMAAPPAFAFQQPAPMHGGTPMMPPMMIPPMGYPAPGVFKPVFPVMGSSTMQPSNVMMARPEPGMIRFDPLISAKMAQQQHHQQQQKRSRVENVSETASSVASENEYDEEDSSVQSHEDGRQQKKSRASSSSSKRNEKHKAPGLGGERRLKIDFSNLGVIGSKPQYFGKSGMVIPDGLCGTHEMHSQQWKFIIAHETTDDNIVVIKWTVTNMGSGKTISVTETAFQAKERQKTGNTICSVVMRKAIEQRVMDLEEELKNPATLANPAQMASIQSLIRELRPKQRNEGILFFGLRHACVQVRSQEETQSKA